MTVNRATMSYEDLRKKLLFNGNYLDVEIAQQADLYQMIIEECTHYGQVLFDLKTKYDFEESQTELRIRKNFENNNIKATEGKVEAEVKTDKALYALKQQIGTAQADYDKWYGLRKAWDMRESSIDSTVKMVMSGYIAYKKPAPQHP